MQVKIEKQDEILLCLPEGEIDIHTSPILRKAFDGIIKNKEKKVVVDLSLVTLIDTSGLATLIEMLHRIQKINGHFKLSNLDTHITKVFMMVKLDQFFELYDTRESAIKAF
ncbi:MAG: STAS domain-containing protein [Candidatus Omnitrophota bacterium]